MGAFDNVSDNDENAVRYETSPEEDFRIELRRDADKFKGIKSSFWAGKMAPSISILVDSDVWYLSDNIERADFCKTQYYAAVELENR